MMPLILPFVAPRRANRNGCANGVTYVELFFDLVFVFGLSDAS